MYKKFFIITLLISFLINPLHISAVVSQETDLKATYKSFRNLVDTFTKYTRISKRAMTDKEWQEFQATAKKVGVVGVILVSAFVLKKGIFNFFTKPGMPEERKKKILPIPGLTEQQTELRQALLNHNFHEVLRLTRLGIRVPKQYLRLQGNILHEIIVPDADEQPHPQMEQVFSNIINAPIIKTFIRTLMDEKDKSGVTPLFAAMHQIQKFPKYADEYLAIINILFKNDIDRDQLGPEFPSSSTYGTLLHAAKHISDSDTQRKVIHWLLGKRVNADTRNTQHKWYDQQ